MPTYPDLTMAEIDAAWQRLTAEREQELSRDLARAMAENARTYSTKPPHPATYGTNHA